MRFGHVLVLLASLTGCPTPSASDAGPGGAGGGAGGAGGGGAVSDGGADAGTLRILMMYSAAQSLSITDPNASRVEALRELFNTLPAAPTTAIAVMVFQGNTTFYLTPNGTGEFVPLTSLTSSDRNTLLARLTPLSAPTQGGGSTDWVRPLANAYELLSADISALQGSRYSIIFVSDGSPTVNQDDLLLCGDSIRRVRELRLVGAGDVRFNTVHVFTPRQPTQCAGDAGWTSGTACRIPFVGNRGACPSAEVDEDAARLRQMAVVGGGTFRDVRNGDAVSFAGLVP